MSLKENIRPVEALKARADEVLAQIAQTRRPVVLTQNGEPKGVLQDVESYERTCRAIALLKLVAQGEEDVRAGRTIPQEKVFEQFRQDMADEQVGR